MLKSFVQFVNEAREGIFKGDLRLGASRKFINRSKDTTAYRVLDFIYRSGDEGRRYTDITRFIVGLDGREYDPKLHRGWWGTNLLAYGGWRGEGKSGGNLLGTYCDKAGKGYVLKPWVKDFFDIEEFGDLDVSPESIEFLSKLNAFGD